MESACVEGEIIKGSFSNTASRREGAPCRVLEGCADGVSVATHLSALSPCSACLGTGPSSSNSSKCDRSPPVLFARLPWPQLNNRLCRTSGQGWRGVCAVGALRKVLPPIPSTGEEMAFPSCEKYVPIPCTFRWLVYAICLSVGYWLVPKSYPSRFSRGKSE